MLLDDSSRLLSYVKDVPDAAWDLIEFADKPLTIIYDNAKNLARNAVAEDGSVGIRITNDSFCKELIRKFRKPIVSTSANVSGKAPPISFSEIDSEIISGVDYVVNLGHTENKNMKPSTIIQIKSDGQFKIIRK